MLNPQIAWQETGVDFWYETIVERPLPKKNMPLTGVSQIYRKAFREGVLVADHDFCEKLKAEHRRN